MITQHITHQSGSQYQVSVPHKDTALVTVTGWGLTCDCADYVNSRAEMKGCHHTRFFYQFGPATNPQPQKDLNAQDCDCITHPGMPHWMHMDLVDYTRDVVALEEAVAAHVPARNAFAMTVALHFWGTQNATRLHEKGHQMTRAGYADDQPITHQEYLARCAELKARVKVALDRIVEGAKAPKPTPPQAQSEATMAPEGPIQASFL